MKRLILILLVLLIFLLPGCAEAPELPQPPAAPVEKTIEAPAAVIELEAPAAPVENKPEAAPDESQPTKEAPAPEPAVKSAAAIPQPAPLQGAPKAEAPVESLKPSAPEVKPAQPAVPEAKPAQPAAPEAKPQPVTVESDPLTATETQAPVPEPEIHTHSYTATVVEPTCTEWGCTKHTCACGDQYKDGCTKPLGHDYQLTGHADATTAAAGYDEYTCSRCGVSYRDTIPQLVQTGATAADAQSACDTVNSYICSHYRFTDSRDTYFGVTWIERPSDVSAAAQSVIGTVDLYAQYYGAQSFYCGYWESGGVYTLVLYWDTV